MAERGDVYGGWGRVYGINGDTTVTFPAGTKVAAASKANGTQDIFALADDNTVQWTSYTDPSNVWQGWTRVGGPSNTFPAGTPVTAVSRSVGHLDIFAVGNDGRVYSNYWSGGGWGGWFPIGNTGDTAPLKSKVAVVGRGAPDGLDIFVIRSNGGLYSTYWRSGGSWASWFRIGSDTYPAGTPVSVVKTVPGRLDVVVQKSDGKPWWTWWEDGVSSYWASSVAVGNSTFPAKTEFALTSRQQYQLDAFAVGNDGHMYGSYNNSSSWAGWYPIGATSTFPVGAAVAAVGRIPTRNDIFVIGNNGGLYSSTWFANTNTWSPFFQIGYDHNTFPTGSRPTTLARAFHNPDGAYYTPGQQMDTFVLGTDRKIYATWWNPGMRPIQYAQ